MADSTTNLDTISSGQSAKEVTANAMFDAASPSVLFGRRASTTSGLTWGYYGGKYPKADGTLLSVPNGTLALTASQTNYILETDGVLSVVTAEPTDWPGPLASDARAVYEVVCGADSVTSYTDYRVPFGKVGAAGSGDSPFDVHAFYPGEPTASAVVLRVPLARAVTFPDDFAGSYGKASAASTGTATFDVQKNGVSVGSIVFTASASATFSTSGAAVSFAAGDVLSIIAPGSADATLADVGIVLAGTRD